MALIRITCGRMLHKDGMWERKLPEAFIMFDPPTERYANDLTLQEARNLAHEILDAAIEAERFQTSSRGD